MSEIQEHLNRPLKTIMGNKPIFYLVVALVVILVANIILTGYVAFMLFSQFPGSSSQFNYKQYVANSLLDYNRRLAMDLKIIERASVKKALADFSYDIEVATTKEDLTQVLLNHPRKVQEIILQEWEAELQDQIILTVNRDAEIKKIAEHMRVNLKISGDEILVEPYNMLSASTLARIQQILSSDNLGREHTIEMEVANGEAHIVVKENTEDLKKLLTEEINSLRIALRDLRISAGLTEMSGSGLIVRIYDQIGAVDNPSIVHDTDIRDVVNELFASGATGIAVGDQRLTTTSSIRCTGPLIKVDDKLIAVNPVEIKVVGDPDLLSSGMEIIKNTMERDRGLSFEVEKVDNITLPGYARGS
ncbi:MAG: DUF881 domain-containing protein [Dethiobacteria bacterium]